MLTPQASLARLFVAVQAMEQLVGLQKFRIEDATVGLWAASLQVKNVDWCHRGLWPTNRDAISNAEYDYNAEAMDDSMHHDLCAGHLLLAHRFSIRDIQTASRFLMNCSGIDLDLVHSKRKLVIWPNWPGG